MNPPAHSLFVMKEIRVHRIRRRALDRAGQPHRGSQPLDTSTRLRREESHRRADTRRADHADGDCLAVAVARVASLFLNRMGDGMTEVQDAAQAALALILTDDVCLDRAGARDHVRCRCGSEGEHIVTMLLQPCEELCIRDNAVLDDLPEPRRDLARRQCPQAVEIHDDGVGLVECADEVLAERMVDGDLTSDARVHLCEEGRRQLHERHAAHVSRGNKARKITDDAAAERKDRRFAVKSQLNRTRIELVRYGKALRGLPGGDGDDRSIHAAARDLLCRMGGIARPDIRIRDDHAACGVSCPTDERCEHLIHPAADLDGVAARTKRNLYRTSHITFSISASPVRCTPPPRAANGDSYPP